MLLKYITLASGFNFLLLAFVLFVKKAPNKNANNIIGVYFLMMSLYSYVVSFRYSAIQDGNFHQLTHFPPFEGFTLLLLGPCVYLFIRSVLNLPIKLLAWKNIPHLIPFIPYVVFNVYFYTLTSQQRTEWFIRGFSEGNIESDLLNAVNYIQIPFYLILSFVLIKNKFKETSIINVGNMLIDISWMKTFLIVNISYVFLTAPLIFYLANENANVIIGSIGMDIQFIYLFVKIAWQKDILDSEYSENRQKNKDGHLKIDESTANEYLQVLDEFMEKQKPFLNENCNLQNIADNTGIAMHQLSSLVNNKLNKNFPDYINEFRICESKKLLIGEGAEKLTIEAVGFNCGFGSKSSFNKAFKKHTNITPSEFRLRNVNV